MARGGEGERKGEKVGVWCEGEPDLSPECGRERGWELVGIVMVSPSESAREGPKGARPKVDH